MVMISNGEAAKKEQKKRLPKRIILVRHGESYGNADLRVFGSTPNHQIQLTPKGIQQAKHSGELINSLIITSDDDNDHKNCKVFFYVSPMARTLETLREMARSFPKRRVVGVKEENLIREQHFGNFNDPSAIARIKEERTTYGRFFYRVPGGESGSEVHDRISSFIESMKSEIEGGRFWDEDNGDEEVNVVVVSHGFTARVFLMKWFGWTIEEFEKLNRMKSSEFQVLELGKVGSGDDYYSYSLAIHHNDDKLMEWGLSPEMIQDQKRRAYGPDDDHHVVPNKWDTHRFLHMFSDH